MKNKFYLKEFQFFDGENTVVFNILSVEGSKITVAVTKCGKIRIMSCIPIKTGCTLSTALQAKNIFILMILRRQNNGKPLRKLYFIRIL